MGANQQPQKNRSYSNLILTRLSEADLNLVGPHLKPVDLPLRRQLEKSNQRIDAVYFPESGFASVVANGGKQPIEVGIIGREGVTGLALIYGHDRAEFDTFMQAEGRGQSLKSKTFRTLIEQSSSLRKSVHAYAYSYFKQTAGTAIANGRNKIEERLARWLLMANDRLDGADLPLTHEFLAMMLAVRRPGVTVALQALEQKGVIARRRGNIVITNSDALERLTHGTYAKPEAF